MECEQKKYINSINLNINTDFPYVVIDVINNKSYPRNKGFQGMHWHEDLQFIYVLNGVIEVQTLNNIVQIKEGEALFVNKNVVHYIKQFGNCHYNSFLFPAYFLEFYAGSPAKTFVDIVTANSQFSIFQFTPTTNWQKSVILILQQLAEIERSKTEFYVYEILVRLSSIWLLMRKNIELPHEKKESIVHIRIQKILRYISEYYPKDITLFDLAMSANISKSECIRCFKLSLNITPYKYLTDFRLSKAAQLLKTTNEPIGNIAIAVGFHQMSHFGKCFREKTGYSPKEYREMENNF